jgi:hypothetical protein
MTHQPWSDWLQRLFSPSAPRRRRKARLHRTGFRLQLEVLEARTVPSFVTAKNTATGANPQYLAVGDFNGDGKPDVVTVSGGTASVLLGNGNGTFQSAVNSTTVKYPSSVAVADVNGDGKPDLITASYLNSTVSVVLGNGNGTFRSPVNYAVESPICLAVGDLNGDGKPDLAVGTHYSKNAISILLGNGDGTFGAASSVAAGYGSNAVAVGGFNGDGKLDLVTQFNAVPGGAVLLGNGNGTFQSAVNYTGAGGPVAVADFNGDHKADLCEFENGEVALLLGNGNGTFKPAKDYYYAGGLNLPPGGLAVADINGDGRPDVIIANGHDYSDCISVLLNNGKGILAAPLLYVADVGPIAVAAADFNGDGRADLVVANNDSTDVSVLFGRGNGTFVAARSYTAGGGHHSATVAAGNFNGDGLSDLAQVNALRGTVSIFLNNGDGTFALTTALNPGLNGLSDVVVADFNGDGRLDLAVNSGGTVAVFLGNGNGTFKRPIDSSSTNALGDLAVGDFNGDGKLDLVGTDSSDSLVDVLLGNGNGTFQSAVNLGVSGGPIAVAVADFNGDGKADLAVANNGDATVGVLLGNGDGTFGAQTTYAVGNSPTDVAAADLNNDGHPDLVVSNTDAFAGNVDVLLNNGAGTFAKAKAYVPGSTARSVAIGDVTGDGIPDIVAVDYYGKDIVTVLVGNGNGTFRAPVNYTVADGSDAVALGNFNGDSPLDVAVADAMPGLTVLLDAVDKDLVVTAPATTTAGNAFSITVTAEDASGKTLTGYTGTVHFSSTDPDATLPADYTFVAGDHGRHTFTGVVLGKAGNRAIVATDLSAPGSAGSATVKVNAGVVTQFGITAPKTATAGTAFNITLMAEDAFGNVVSGYQGTVTFTSSDGSAVLPGNYTFVAGDHGKHTFSATLNPAGSQTITATDTSNNTIKGKATVKVNGPSPGLASGSPDGDWDSA